MHLNSNITLPLNAADNDNEGNMDTDDVCGCISAFEDVVDEEEDPESNLRNDLRPIITFPGDPEKQLYLSVTKWILNMKNSSTSESDIDMFVKDSLNVMANLSTLKRNYLSILNSKINTTYSRQKFLDEAIIIIKPKGVVLGKKQIMKFSRSKGRNVPVWKRGYYIPFIESLKQLLSMPELVDILNNQLTTTQPATAQDLNQLQTDYHDSEFCRNHPLFSSHKSIKIILYYDEIGISNSLGTRKRTVGMFYYTLANIPRYWRSQDRCIHLLACADKCDIIEFGLDDLLSDFIDSVNILQQDGIDITVKGSQNNNNSYLTTIPTTTPTTMNLKGSLLVIVGDLLALASIHGFKCGFKHASLPCFLCKTTKDELQTISNINECSHRTMDEYLDECDQLDNCATQEEFQEFSKKFGINHRSVFTFINGFDIFKQTALDSMHIYLEGICKRHLKLFFMNLADGGIWEGNYSWAKICTATGEYHYPPMNEVPNSKFSWNKDNQIPLSSAQMLSVIKNIPFIIKNILGKPPTMNGEWTCVLQLRALVCVSFSKEIDRTTKEDYHNLIEQYLNNYDDLYGVQQRLPKHHFALHFCKQLNSLGPLKFSNCLPFEKKHS
ncbi:unnamed protein product, partial [Didymodactylos carnosus]